MTSKSFKGNLSYISNAYKNMLHTTEETKAQVEVKCFLYQGGINKFHCWQLSFMNLISDLIMSHPTADFWKPGCIVTFIFFKKLMVFQNLSNTLPCKLFQMGLNGGVYGLSAL